MSRSVRTLAAVALCGCGGTAQLPPTGDAAVRAWLEQKHYAQWRCESAAHPSRNGSPHGMNRVCSNDALFGHAGAAYPEGAATVKELYASDGATLQGHSVMRKISADPGPSSWYFFEVFEGRTYADGSGEPGCSTCHERAGSGSMPGKDFVFTQVD